MEEGDGKFDVDQIGTDAAEEEVDGLDVEIAAEGVTGEELRLGRVKGGAGKHLSVT